MRTKKLVTEIGILNAPTDFLFIPLVVRETDQLRPPLKTHLVGTLVASTLPGALSNLIGTERTSIDLALPRPRRRLRVS